MTTGIEKVTAFVTRMVNGRRELLLFQHPYAGIQIPAGAVDRVKRPRLPPSVKRRKRPACATLQLTDTLARRRWCCPIPGACSSSPPGSMPAPA